MSKMHVDREYLKYQYADAEKLRIRRETHEAYSEEGGDLVEWVAGHVASEPGLRLLDVGCGPGVYHPRLVAEGALIVGIDLFPGMLRQVREQASAGGYAVVALRGSAEALPLGEATFERVMANHMLYHVEDQLQALREMRRVLKPGGRVVLTTNAADSGARFYELHEAAARQLGYAPKPETFSFTLDSLPLVSSVFPEVQRAVRRDSFVFPDAEPALKYYATGFVDWIEDMPADGSHRAPLVEAVRDSIDRIITREGSFRVQKATGCFVADVT